MSLDYDEFNALFTQFERTAIHLEMRDSYGTEIELPHMAKWAAGEPDDLSWLREWCDLVREGVQEGKSFKRAHVVGEPLSDYQRWSHSVMRPHIDAGSEVRWVPRRLVSSIAFPGNDFWLFDDRLVVFHHYAGNGRNIDFTTSTDPRDVQLCKSAFQNVWKLGIPHNEYKPT
jgi:hypothetical protein